MLYIGVDHHQKHSHITVMDKEGEVVKSLQLRNHPKILREFVEGLGQPCEAVLEAGRNWALMYDWLEEMVNKVYLAHPLKVRAIAEARIKTDTIDSRTLAHLLRTNLLPEAHVPSKETRAIKNVLRQRMFYIVVRGMLKNRIRNLLERNHVEKPDYSDLFGKSGLRWLKAISLPSPDRKLLNQDISLLETLSNKIKATEGLIAQLAEGDLIVKLLKSLPGIGDFLGVLLRYEIDDIERFPSANKLYSYAGLIPSTYASGNRVYHGRLTKQGNKFIRWAMIEAVSPAVRSSRYVRNYYERIKSRSGGGAARIATTRKLLKIIYSVLKEKRPYIEPKVSGPWLPSKTHSL